MWGAGGPGGAGAVCEGGGGAGGGSGDAAAGENDDGASGDWAADNQAKVQSAPSDNILTLPAFTGRSFLFD